MKTTLIAMLMTGAATAAAAGGYNAPVVEAAPAAPVVIASSERASGDWTGFYAGLQFGKVDAEEDYDDSFDDSFNYTADIDANHYGLHVGYLHDFGRWVGGAELSYDKLDDFEVDGIDVSSVLDGEMLQAKLIAGYDAGQFLPYAAVSVANVELDLAGFTADETGFGYGVGVKYMVTPRFMVGAEYMRRNFEADSIEGESDIDLNTLSLNGSYRF